MITINIGIFDSTKFEYIDISNWNVSNVENMGCMFQECTQLKSIGDLSNWDILKVNDMNHMFADCYHLKSVDNLSNWNVSNVNFMNNAFKESGITNIPDWYRE